MEGDLRSSDSEVYSENDSDQELQSAFKRGALKGLSYEVKQKPLPINNKIGLKKSLDDLRPTDLPWIERMDQTVDPIPPSAVMLDQLGENPDDLRGPNVHNDYKREMKFYREAQAATISSCARLHSMNVLTKRPKDYFAEMAKSDAHMDKVRNKLLSMQQSHERSEKVRKLRDLKKFGKKVQQEVFSKRQKEKKEMLNAVKSFKKGKSSSLDFLQDTPSKSRNLAAQRSKEQFRPGKKRQEKNAKFGFGGQKKRTKHNTIDSVDNIDKVPRFSSAANQKAKKNRPGKRNRQKGKNPH